MSHLALSLLGAFQVTLDGQPVTGFKSNKVRALLAFLAVEADRPHRREALSNLLWGDWTDPDALGNLRYALYNLRCVLRDRYESPPFFLISYDTLQFNAASDIWLDVVAVNQAASHSSTDINGLEQAADLYRGYFLEGFSLGNCPAFDKWTQLVRERLERRYASILHTLASLYEQSGAYVRAEDYTWRQLEFDPLDEIAYRQIMRILANSGQRGAALTQYEQCRARLMDELGVEPSEATTQLCEHIRNGGKPGYEPDLCS